MANTQTASELVVTKFLSDFFKEYIRDNRFSRYTGTSVNNVICIKEGRKTISVPLVTRLKGNGVTGSSTLRGSGESIGNYGHDLVPTYYRHAVEFDKEEIEKPAIDLMRAARPLLLDWAKELTRDQIIDAMMAINNGTSYFDLKDATEAQADAWVVNNSDRILFGALKSNGGGTDHSAGLLACDTSADLLSASVISVAKRMAKLADPHIRPIKTKEDEEWYIMFCDPWAFKAAKADATILAANKDARPRNVMQNPIFADGDMIYDGVILREVPEIGDAVDYIDGTNTTLNMLTGGASSARVGVNFLCGAQALGFGLGQRPKTVVDRDWDYGFQPGVACECKHDIDKMFYNDKQHGMVTVYTATVKDA